MDFFMSSAYARPVVHSPAQLFNLHLLSLSFFFYFLMIRPQKKKMEEEQNFSQTFKKAMKSTQNLVFLGKLPGLQIKWSLLILMRVEAESFEEPNWWSIRKNL